MRERTRRFKKRRAKRIVISNEWIFEIRRVVRARSGRVVVQVDNVERDDRSFVLALARLAGVWLNTRAERRRRQ